MKQDFKTGDLKQELERALGFRLHSLERLDGASALNFKATRSSDGYAFAVKCSPPTKRYYHDRLVEHLAVLTTSKTIRRVFERECPPSFCGYDLLCTQWCEGVRVFPDRLTDEEFARFLTDYAELSAAMQKVKLVGERRPIAEWRNVARSKCRGLAGWLLRPKLEALSPADCDYREEHLRVIHGDFHHGNFLFAGGSVRGFLDLEEFRWGYPADDLLRYIVCAAEHLRWYESYRRRRILKQFEQAVRRLPYSRHEWMMAINARYVCKVNKRTRTQDRIRLTAALNLVWRSGFYEKLRKTADAVLKEGGK